MYVLYYTVYAKLCTDYTICINTPHYTKFKLHEYFIYAAYCILYYSIYTIRYSIHYTMSYK